MLNRLEKAVLQEIRAAAPEISAALGEQLDGVIASNRENTNAGFFTTLRPCRTNTLIEGPHSIGNVFAKIEDAKSNDLRLVQKGRPYPHVRRCFHR